MEKILIDVESPYEVYLGNDILKYAGAYLREMFSPCKALIITDDLVETCWFDCVNKSIIGNGFSTKKYVIPHGEQSKRFSNLIEITELLAKENFSRNDLVVALGGGVVGDLSGFAASVYMRGIKLVQIPTTLLAQIDSSVGGKTAINLSCGKNLVGTFYQPNLVIADVNTLSTLPEYVYREGMGEMVKYGILDEKMFSYLSCCKKPDATVLIKRAIEIKRDIVVSDEKESGIRAYLNLGHTVGHAIEQLSGYTVFHGDAVAQGIYYIVNGSYKAGILPKEDYFAIISMLEANDIYFEKKYDVESIAKVVIHDKKMKDGKINVIVVERVGKVSQKEMTIEKFKEFIS